MLRRSLITAIVADMLLALVAASPTLAQEPAALNIDVEQNASAVMDVTSYGARGDGKADDTEAIQAAFDSTVSTDGHRRNAVFLPIGTYRITKTLKVGRACRNLRISGAGFHGRHGFAAKNPFGLHAGISRIVWDGPAGAEMFEAQGAIALAMNDIQFDGNHKAGTILKLDSLHGSPFNYLQINRVELKNGQIGIECGRGEDNNAADMTFIDLIVSDMKTCGFLTHGNQQVNYVFIRPNFGRSPIGMDFRRGGGIVMIQPCFGFVNTCIKTTNAGINNGHFNITGFFQENYSYDNHKKRTVILDARDEVQVTFTSMATAAHHLSGPHADFETPNFILGPTAQVRICGSMICGRIAELTGSADAPPTLLTFENCRFRLKSDPRKDITCDDNSGFILKNCTVQTEDEILFFQDYFKHPRNVRIITGSAPSSPAAAGAVGRAPVAVSDIHPFFWLRDTPAVSKSDYCRKTDELVNASHEPGIIPWTMARYFVEAGAFGAMTTDATSSRYPAPVESYLGNRR